MLRSQSHLVLLVSIAMLTQAKADCDAILTSGLRNITVSYSAEAAIAQKYYSNYKKDIHSMTDDQLATLEIEITGSGKGNAGYTRKQREDDLRTWFETNQSIAESAKSQYAASNTVYQGAVNAWASCNSLRTSSNVEIQPKISTDNRTVVMAIHYTGRTHSGVKFYGLAVENFTCTTDVPEPTLKKGIEITNESISVTCNRDAPTTTTISGEQFTKLERGTIAVKTAADPFLLTFSAELTPSLPKSAEDNLKSTIKALEERITTVDKNLTSTKAELGKSIIDSIGAFRNEAAGAYVRKDDTTHITKNKVYHLKSTDSDARVANRCLVILTGGSPFWITAIDVCKPGNTVFQGWELVEQ